MPHLRSPADIQDFLNKLPFNFEKKGETYMSVERTLRAGTAHCFEGALVAAAEIQKLGQRPLLLDLKTSKKDIDHVVALFKRSGYWGAISKTNHGVLRYREPIYKTIRELALSYFHEYFLPDGTKTLVSYSRPFNLNKFGTEWLTGDKDLFHIIDALDESPHISIIPKGHKLRKADRIEIKLGRIVEWKDN
ncbi:hypothetical protein KW785_01610 [Candidatus Parcubacteria bacterium]|nr:hypothetical protein [Candidatus Parcubacteria bacterium]